MVKRFIAVSIMIVLLLSCGGVPRADVSAAKKLSLSKTKLTIKAGYTKQLKVKGAGKKSITWSTSKRSVASVSVSGLVKGEGQGTAKIIAKVGKKKLKCKITVKDPAIAISKQIEKEKNERIAKILSDTTQVDVSGKKYYVSSSEGSDANDGLSPEHPWKTAAKVCDGTVKSGDGVYFKRGDLWRDDVFREYVTENVVYSAYGTGEKPTFYGSPENGTGSQKWSLVPGTSNIWKFYRPLGYGSVVLDGKEVGHREKVYWNEDRYYCQFSDTPFDLSMLDNHSTFTDIDLTEYQKEDDNWFDDHTLLFVQEVTQGDFYFRCDEGNPGTVFSSIEFCVGSGVNVAGGSTVNNICVKYIAYQGISQSPNFSNGIHVQNCEVAYCGSGFIGFRASNQEGITGGEGTGCQGRGGRIIGNYIHNSSEGGLTVEDGWNEVSSDNQKNMGDVLISKNVLENNNGGVGVMNFFNSGGGMTFSDITISDNIFYKTMYIQKLFHTISGEGAMIKFGFWYTGDKSNINNIKVENNTFAFGAPKIVELGWTDNAEIQFQGNTYLLGRYHDVVTYNDSTSPERDRFYGAEDPATAKKALEFLGDKTGKVYTYYTGLEGIDVNRAKSMGFISAAQKKNPDAQLTEKQWISILTKSLNKIDSGVADEFKKIASAPSSKVITLEKAYGYVYQIQGTLEDRVGVKALDYAPYYDLLGYHGVVSGYKASAKLTVETASMIAVRLYDQWADLNNYRYYLAKV